jgi:hypothetical protein
MNQQAPVAPRALMVFAHADDETLLAGALISKLVKDGYVVKVLCLAPGSDERTERLRKACAVLGVNTVETLRYSEGEMWPVEGLNTTGELDSCLSTAPTNDIARRISGRIIEFDPEVVITHSRYGDYGHADHAATYRATVSAVEQLTNPAGREVRLYELDWPKWVVRLNARLMNMGGGDIRRMGPDGGFDLSMALKSVSKCRLSINVSSELGVRRQASVWYGPEIAKGPLPMRILERLPLWIQRTFLGQARLNLVVAPDDFDESSGL